MISSRHNKVLSVHLLPDPTFRSPETLSSPPQITTPSIRGGTNRGSYRRWTLKTFELPSQKNINDLLPLIRRIFYKLYSQRYCRLFIFFRQKFLKEHSRRTGVSEQHLRHFAHHCTYFTGSRTDGYLNKYKRDHPDPLGLPETRLVTLNLFCT